MADDIDILTLDEAQAALRQGAVTANDTVIARIVTASSTAVDMGIGPVVIRTVNEETLDGSGVFVQLRYWPVVTVTAVVEDGVTLTADQWYCDTEKGQLYRRDGDYDYPWEVGRDNVTVTYTAGRFASTDLVDPWHKQGAVLLARHLWRSEQWSTSGITGGTDFDVPQVAAPTYAIPQAVIDWYGPQWRLSSRNVNEPRGGFV